MLCGRIEARIFANDFELWTEAGIETVLGERCFDWARSLPSAPAGTREDAAGNYRSLILVGMGGATLSAAAYACVYRDQLECNLTVLDSTSSDSLAHILTAPPRFDCCYVIASKSGQTLETLAIAQTLLAHVDRPDLFTVVTDSQSSALGSWATQHGISIRFSDPHVPGRFSSLAKLAMVPVGLLGIDVAAIQNARDEFSMALSSDDECAAALRKLAARLAVACLVDRSELHIDTPQPLLPVARWIEQLVAESLGKSGLGVLPVITYRQQETVEPEAIRLRLAVGHPVREYSCSEVISSAEQLAQLFLRWQSVVSMAAYLIGMDPYDQPEVERAKQMHRLSLDSDNTVVEQQEASNFRHDINLGAEKCDVAVDGLFEDLEASLQAGDYIALFAYVNPTPANESLLAGFAHWLETVFSPNEIRVIYSFGPQYLHSTGQFHKSLAQAGRTRQVVNPGKTVAHKSMAVARDKVSGRVGHFLYVEAEAEHDFAIAGTAGNFEWLIKKQAHLDATYLAGIAGYETVTPSLIRCSTDLEESLIQLQALAAARPKAVSKRN